jgi:quercetin dioxygenase-like cupin family protein
MKLELWRRGGLLVCLALIWAVSAMWIGHAQQPAAPAGANEDANFTGKAWRIDNQGLGLSRRGFEASARSNWHTHDAAQLLFVQEGAMRYQVRGQKMNLVGLHGSAYLPGGVPHWHGAVPGQGLTHVSVTFGPGIKWMEKVGDDVYSGKASR